jgi:hypothetical protein
MNTIVKIKFPELWNSEYPLVINRIIDIIEAHDPADLYFGQSFERLAAFRPQLAKIEVQERSNQDSKILYKLDHERNTLFRAIYAVAKSFQRTSITDINKHAQEVMTVVEKHRKDILSSNYTARTKCLYDFIIEIKELPKVMKSLKELSLLSLFVRIEEVNAEFDQLFMQRNKRQAETEQVDIRDIRLKCDKAITLLWSAIEFCCHEHHDKDYLPLITTINNLNTYYKQQLATRNTKRKANQDVSEEKLIETME